VRFNSLEILVMGRMIYLGLTIREARLLLELLSKDPVTSAELNAIYEKLDRVVPPKRKP
jgi:hypothetical protein